MPYLPKKNCFDINTIVDRQLMVHDVDMQNPDHTLREAKIAWKRGIRLNNFRAQSSGESDNQGYNSPAKYLSSDSYERAKKNYGKLQPSDPSQTFKSSPNPSHYSSTDSSASSSSSRKGRNRKSRSKRNLEQISNKNLQTEMEISEVKSELNKLGQSMVKTEDVNELKIL